MPEHYKTLALDNQFRFVCPIFGAEVAMRECMSLRDLQYKGQGPEIRKGCQACISAQKCPIVHVLREIGPGVDPYYSPTPKVGKLSDHIMRSIAPIVVPESTMKSARFADMPQRQAELIQACDGLKGFKNFKGTQGATLEDVGIRTPSEHASEGNRIHRSVTKTPAPAEEPQDAAVTGDLSAALNRAMEDVK